MDKDSVPLLHSERIYNASTVKQKCISSANEFSLNVV